MNYVGRSATEGLGRALGAGHNRGMSPLQIRPLGGAPGCLVMILVSILLSVVLTVVLNLVL